MTLTRKTHLIPFLLLITAAPVIVWALLWSVGLLHDSSDSMVKLNDRIAEIHPVQVDGQWRIRIGDDEQAPVVDAAEFVQTVARLQDEAQGHSPLFVVLNITTWFSLFWVAVGLLGQVLFTGRMIVQWLVSEKHKRSVVPTAFWWMSLAGASMLITYFIWRKDIVGILGQATGWFIYIRNIWLIYQPQGRLPEVTGDPGPPGLNVSE